MIKSLTPRRALLLAVLAVFGVILLRQCADSAGQPSVAQATWVRVEPQVLENRLGLVGRLQAVDQVTLAAPFDGQLAEVRVAEGQRVEQGQTLLRLDPAQLLVQLRQAKAELLKAQGETRRLAQWAHGSEVARARRSLASARQALASGASNLRDTRALFDRGIVARMELEALEQQVRNQQQDVSAASEELASTLAQGQGAARQIAEIELANAQARQQALEALYARRELTAPLSGNVVRPAPQDGGKPLLLQPGVAVTQGMPLLGVVGQERFQVLTRVEETDLHLLREGMPVHISGDGFAAQLHGRILSIGIQSDSSDPQATGAHFEVKVSVQTPPAGLDQPLRAGMSTQLAVLLLRDEQGMAVPPQALRQGEDGQTYVMYRATADARAQRKPVVPGVAVSQGVMVQGLEAGFVEVPAS